MDGSLGALVLRCRTRNYTSLVVMGSSKRKLCFRYCEMVISWPRRERRCGAAAGSRTPGRGGAVRVCRGTMPPARNARPAPVGGGARTVNAGRPSRGATMVGRRDAPWREPCPWLRWERCSSGSGAPVGAMLWWERCSGGSDAPVGAVGGATTRSSSAPPEHGTARRRSVGRGIVAAVMQVAST